MTNPLHIILGPLFIQTPATDASGRRSYNGRRPSFSKGFTLLELLVVLILIGVVLATALPRFAGTGRSYLRTDASKLSSFLRFVSDTAATRKVYYKVSFDITAGEIRTERSRDGVRYLTESDPNVRSLKLAEGVAIEDMTVEGLGRVNAGTADVIFTPVGGPPPFTVHLTASGNKVAVAFNPYSGEVSMKDGYAAP